jgi:DNA-binding MarR family transcriptional regulator
MNSNMQKNLRIHSPEAAAILPPAIMEETPWDILLALHSDRHCRLSLAKLASLVSVARPVLDRWLAGLEQRRLITGATHLTTGELRATLTSAGRELLDGYLSSTSVLLGGIH